MCDTSWSSPGGQIAEVHLLAEILPMLPHRSVVDVGAKQGYFARAMLGAGAEEIHVIEFEPRNVEFLRERFRNEARVNLHVHAIGREDAQFDPHAETDVPCELMPRSQGVLAASITGNAAGGEARRINARSLGGLIASGALPLRIGILKISAGDLDLSVRAGLSTHACDVILVEGQHEHSKRFGGSAWSVEKMVVALAPHGFKHFAFIAHGGEAVILQFDDASVPPGGYGNLVFLHDRAFLDLLPTLLMSASALAQGVVKLAERRLAAMEELMRARDFQASRADERLGTIEELVRERDVQAEAAAERLRTIEELARERDVQAAAAAERLRIIAGLTEENNEGKG